MLIIIISYQINQKIQLLLIEELCYFRTCKEWNGSRWWISGNQGPPFKRASKRRSPQVLPGSAALPIKTVICVSNFCQQIGVV
jgi:hypothetical protein